MDAETFERFVHYPRPFGKKKAMDEVRYVEEQAPLTPATYAEAKALRLSEAAPTVNSSAGVCAVRSVWHAWNGKVARP